MKRMLIIPLSLLLGLLTYFHPPVIGSPAGDTQTTGLGRRPPVYGKLNEEFRNSFPNAQRVVWQQEKDHFVVSFLNAGVLNRIVYDRQGRFVSSLRNYDESGLPYYLTSVLKKEFPGQKIFGVTEISNSAGICYMVKLEGSKRWTTINMAPTGDFYVEESYKKML